MVRNSRDMTHTALMVVLLTVCAWVTIPAPVPFTLQTFGVFCALTLLGARKGATAIGVYLAMGFVGLPVFSGFSGGIGVLLGPTGGYLTGYLVCAIIVGWLTGKKKLRQQFAWTCFSMALGTLACYAVGTVWFLVVMQGTYNLVQAILVCVVPYLMADGIKILVAAAVAVPIRKIVRRME